MSNTSLKFYFKYFLIIIFRIGESALGYIARFVTCRNVAHKQIVERLCAVKAVGIERPRGSPTANNFDFDVPPYIECHTLRELIRYVVSSRSFYCLFIIQL